MAKWLVSTTEVDGNGSGWQPRRVETRIEAAWMDCGRDGITRFHSEPGNSPAILTIPTERLLFAKQLADD